MKAVNTKSVVLMICGKINRQQKIEFNICKQLNGPVLKSLKSSFLGRFSEKKNWPGPGQNFVFRFRPGRVLVEISISLSGRTGLEPKFQFSFRARPVSDQNFNFSFEPSRNFFLFFEPGRARSEKSGPSRRVVCTNPGLPDARTWHS